MLNTPIQMLLVMLAGWVNEEQRSVTDQIASVVRALPIVTTYGSESILVRSSAEARVDDVVEDRAESVAEPEAETRLVVGLE
jgi:hypothetical protein